MRQINIGGELRNLVVEHKRNKKMYLRVKEDGILFVTCPRYVSEQEILSFILEKQDWIIKVSKKEKKNKSEKKERKDNKFFGKKVLKKNESENEKIKKSYTKVLTLC